jgi:glycosyltransferase involved in cell wall biosynthesis
MIYEKFRELFPKSDPTSHYKRILVEEADKIIAISENTKKDLTEFFGVDSSKIDVIYLGSSMSVKSNFNIKLNLPEKYILFVGSRGGYKNFNRFIRSMHKILKKDKKFFVICAGGGNFNKNELKILSELDINKQVLQYNVDDNTLSYFYKNALAFVFPSLYEGFGIPILESFACGCPLICSNVSSLPEIAGNAAYYFDPYSEESIMNAISQVLNDSSLRFELIKKGYEQLKKFSWKKTAEKTKKIYESLIK